MPPPILTAYAQVVATPPLSLPEEHRLIYRPEEQPVSALGGRLHRRGDVHLFHTSIEPGHVGTRDMDSGHLELLEESKIVFVK
jgi:hypothetical protein